MFQLRQGIVVPDGNCSSDTPEILKTKQIYISDDRIMLKRASKYAKVPIQQYNNEFYENIHIRSYTCQLQLEARERYGQHYMRDISRIWK